VHLHGENTRKIKSGQCRGENSKAIFNNWDKAFWKQCGDCGETREDVVETVCPYAQNTRGMEVLIVVCEDCYTKRLLMGEDE